MRIPSIATVLLLALSPEVAWAQTTYYVDNTDGGASDSNPGTESSPWQTIAQCASAMAAGDTCMVQPGGVYDERVTQSTSGSASSPIAFVAGADPRPVVRAFTLRGGFIRVQGFEVTNAGMSSDSGRSIIFTSQDDIEIVGNYIHDTTNSAIHAMDYSGPSDRAQRCSIRQNVIEAVGAPSERSVAVQVTADSCLIEENDVSHFEDAFRVYGERNVLRNNVVHDVASSELAGAHPDAFQSYCNGAAAGDSAANYLLLEGFTVHTMRSADAHGFLINGTSSCGGSSTVIARYNSFHDIGSGIYYGDDNEAFGDNHKFYNNTVVSSGLDSGGHVAITLSGIDYGGVFNNILYDAIVDRAPFSGYGLKPMSNSAGDYDLAYLSVGSRSWDAPVGTEPNAVLNEDPLFTNLAGADFTLQPSSPARDAGGPLTSVASGDTGSGATLVIDDAHFFQPGWAGTEADWIAVGTVTNAVQISDVDYATNTITLAGSVTRTSGDAVWLYRDSSGRTVLIDAAPDIGAFELGSECAPDCAGRTCGTDGCGGTCGTCSGGGSCNGFGVCVDAPAGDAGAIPDGGRPDGASALDGGAGGPGDDGGCSCHAAGVRRNAPLPIPFLAVFALLLVTRRR